MLRSESETCGVANAKVNKIGLRCGGGKFLKSLSSAAAAVLACYIPLYQVPRRRYRPDHMLPGPKCSGYPRVIIYDRCNIARCYVARFFLQSGLNSFIGSRNVKFGQLRESQNQRRNSSGPLHTVPN